MFSSLDFFFKFLLFFVTLYSYLCKGTFNHAAGIFLALSIDTDCDYLLVENYKTLRLDLQNNLPLCYSDMIDE